MWQGVDISDTNYRGLLVGLCDVCVCLAFRDGWWIKKEKEWLIRAELKDKQDKDGKIEQEMKIMFEFLEEQQREIDHLAK